MIQLERARAEILIANTLNNCSGHFVAYGWAAQPSGNIVVIDVPMELCGHNVKNFCNAYMLLNNLN